MHVTSALWLLITFLAAPLNVGAVNHWIVSVEGKIQPKIDSPFFLRRPNDLVAFLRQSEYLQMIILLNAKLLLLKTELIKKMEQSNTYTIDFMYQTDCIINYLVQESDMYSTLKAKKYFNRINTKKFHRQSDTVSNTAAKSKSTMPICESIGYCMACMDHLESMTNRGKLEMSPELALNAKELGLSSMNEILVSGLRNDPQSWKYPVLSSYYWRALGMANQAMECARRAVFLSPRKYKDIALLSMGTILQRSNRSSDALIVLHAARDHAPNVVENQVALANGYFLVSNFNRSIDCFEIAKVLDPSYSEKEKYMRKSMTCFKYIKTKLKQIEKQVMDMKNDMVTFTEGKEYLDKYYEKLLREQVPIGARLSEPSFDVHSHHLLHHGQYCSIRKTQQSKEPVLFCDFYSDLQMKLNEDSTIDTIQNYIETKTEFVKNQWNLSLGAYRHLDIESFSGQLDVPEE
ncbi:Tetratricopeptide repeat protein 17 [Pseudolycoriella hygida]|uniref:Tetratricopeptide repeat protein 17 n=1 Tax=Pseudolycoriella hygida TaxID=35572 RepID=A0A9Q0MYX0_9DIPT|nr:Tetratricopeptide repeat protein 17 [Pseudolycoriella hygida]